jgi:putative effector of murein hydrolase
VNTYNMLKELGANITFKTYNGMAHGVSCLAADHAVGKVPCMQCSMEPCVVVLLGTCLHEVITYALRQLLVPVLIVSDSCLP